MLPRMEAATRSMRVSFSAPVLAAHRARVLACRFTDLPTWHTHSTITGQITEFGRKNMRSQDVQKTRFESSREEELQKQLEDHKNSEHTRRPLWL